MRVGIGVAGVFSGDVAFRTVENKIGLRALCIVNSATGERTLARWQRFSAELRRHGVAHETAVTTKPGDALRLGRKGLDRCDVMVAVGGDGTVFEVVNAILSGGSARPALGIVPFGTGNDIASTIGIRGEGDALQALVAGRALAIDLIEVQCMSGGEPLVRHAMLFASVGITSELLKHTTPRLKRFFGQRFAYIAGLMFALRRYSPEVMKLTCDGRRVEGRYLFACASNGARFGGGMKIAPDARIDDGMLNVNLIKPVGILEVLRHLPKLLQGRHTTHPKVSYRTAVNMVIETEHPIAVAADGDLIGQTPARFQVRPQALRVLAPRQTQAG